MRVEASVVKEARGTDLQTVSERIFDDVAFLHTLANAIHKVEADYRAVNGGPVPARQYPEIWRDIKVIVQRLCMKESKDKSRRTSAEEALSAAEITSLQSRIDSGQAGASTYAALQKAKEKLRSEQRKSFSLFTTLEREAYSTGQKHDISSAAFYRQWGAGIPPST